MSTKLEIQGDVRRAPDFSKNWTGNDPVGGQNGHGLGPRFLLRTAVVRLARHTYGWIKLRGARSEARDLRIAPQGSALRALVDQHDKNIAALAAQPFVCATWPSAVRLTRMIEHCAVIDQLGPPFNLTRDQYLEILHFDLDEQQCRLMIDQPEWLGSDGLLSASLWVGDHRIFSISFCLSGCEQTRTAYIGGIQGRKHPDTLEQYRRLTKAAHGIRPRDLMFELFRMLLPQLQVVELKGVSNSARYQMTKRMFLSVDTNDQVLLDYDEIWQSRGGVNAHDGFYLLPVKRERRDPDQVPPRKRSMYARRYAWLDKLGSELSEALGSRLIVHSHRREC